MRVKYYLGAMQYAERERDIIPRVEEGVRFNDGFFKVVAIIHVETINNEHVAIQLTEDDSNDIK